VRKNLHTLDVIDINGAPFLVLDGSSPIPVPESFIEKISDLIKEVLSEGREQMREESISLIKEVSEEYQDYEIVQDAITEIVENILAR
jgi:glycosyltransferase involved in cell wall biosynthesis